MCQLENVSIRKLDNFYTVSRSFSNYLIDKLSHYTIPSCFLSLTDNFSETRRYDC